MANLVLSLSFQERRVRLQQGLPTSGIFYGVRLPVRNIAAEQVSVSGSASAARLNAKHSMRRAYICGNTPCDPDASHFVLDSMSFNAIFKSVI